MGWGDDIMTTGIVRRAFALHGKPLCVGDGQTRWSEIFDGNQKISRFIHPGALWVRSFEGRRPYIDYLNSSPGRFAFVKNFRAEPGEIFLREDEIAPYKEYQGYVYIEPNIKGLLGQNKDWGFHRWQQVVDALADAPFVQGAGRRLRGVAQAETPSFRHACGLLSLCKGFVGTDGGLHHAAAALGKPAIVVWGGFAPPRLLGYETHVNLCHATSWCGHTKPCEHCTQALSKVSVASVINAIKKMVAV